MIVQMVKQRHIPVMLNEVIELLSPKRGQIVLDCTVGCGGHSRQLLERVAPEGLLVGIDYDSRALEVARENLSSVEGGRFYLFTGPFSHLADYLNELNISSVDIVLFDLGVSSLQLDDPDRGFSFRYDSFLDMRMNQDLPLTAWDLVNSLNEDELTMIFWKYGEVKNARQVARQIVKRRRGKSINTTSQLVDVVLSCSRRNKRIHPATQVFQALRIVVNNELGELEAALLLAKERLSVSGRIAVISFHSLEDRMVKHMFRMWHNSGDFRLVNKKVIKPTIEEVRNNCRARSAKLRVIERIK